MEPVDADVLDEPAPRGVAFRDVPWRLSHVVVGVAPFLAIVVAWLTVPVRIIPAAVGLPVALLTYLWMLVYPLAVARRNGWRPRFSVRFVPFALELLIAGFTVLATWGLLIVGYTLWFAVFGPPRQASNPLVGATLSANPVVLITILLLACAGAPLIEEVSFRGVAYNAFRRISPRAVAVLIQAVAFGFMHATYGGYYAVVTGVIGLSFALVYEVRKTLLTPILCHAIHNTVTAVFVLLALGWTTDRPTLGVSVVPHEQGVRVAEVTPGSGAEAAGIREGDVLVSVNGFAVQSIQDVRLAFHDKKPGETIPVEFIRGGQVHRAEIVLGHRGQPNSK